MFDPVMIIKAIIIGIVEGITEFLPISSTGHMIIVDEFVKLSNNKMFSDMFMVVIQLGAILSVILYFWNKIWPFSGTRDEQKDKLDLWGKIITAFLPAVVLGFLLDDPLEKLFFKPVPVAITLILYGIIIIIVEMWNAGRKGFKVDSFKDLSYKTAVFIGLFQCLAMIPGTSRSAATIIGAMLLGLSRFAAAEFSFYLAVPTMIAATGLKLIKNGLLLTPAEWVTLAFGFITAFIIAYLVIKVFMNYIRSKDFKVFGYYRIIFGTIVLLYFLFK